MSFIKSNAKFGHKDSSVVSFNVVSNIGQAHPDYLSTPQVITISAQGATDTASGTGARKVRIEGMGSGWIEQSEELWLDATSPVSTSLAWLAPERMFVTNCGSNEDNASRVWAGYGSVTTGVPASKLLMINSMAGQTQQLTWSIPVNHEAHIHGILLSSGKVAGQDAVSTFQFRTKDMSNPDGAWRDRWTVSAFNGGAEFNDRESGFIIAGPARVEVQERSSVAGAFISGIVTYDLYSQE